MARVSLLPIKNPESFPAASGQASDCFHRLEILRSFLSAQLARYPYNVALADLYRKVTDRLARMEESL